MHTHLNKFNRSAALLTSVKLSISGQKVGSPCGHSPFKELRGRSSGDSLRGACSALFGAAFFMTSLRLALVSCRRADIWPVHLVVQFFARHRTFGQALNLRTVLSIPAVGDLLTDSALGDAQLLSQPCLGEVVLL
jgi:hypothetical protein